MDDLIKENLEDHLSGALGGERKARWESYLAQHPKAAEQVALFEKSALLLQELRPPTSEMAEPDPGFFARVMQRVDQERAIPFWMVFLQPAFVRQVAFAGLMWFALVGAYAVTFGGNGQQTHYAEYMLSSQPTPEYEVRMGADLDQNRESMMAVLMSAAD